MAAQTLALECLDSQECHNYVLERIDELKQNRIILWNAIAPIYKDRKITMSQGSIYFLVPMPLTVTSIEQERAVIEYLTFKHKVVVVPGHVFGSIGWIRISYANKRAQELQQVAQRLANGLQELSSMSAQAVISEVQQLLKQQ